MTLNESYAFAKGLVASGKSEQAREYIVRESLGLADSVVDAFCRKHQDHKELSDELKSSLSVDLLQSVDACLASSPDDFSAFVATALRNACASYEQIWNGFSGSDETVRKQRNLCGKLSSHLAEIDDELRQSPGLDRESVLHDERDRLSIQIVKASPLAKRALAPDDNEIAGQNPFSLPELREVIDSCCLTDNDRSVVELRSQGFTDAEVAEQSGLCRQTVLKIRKAVEGRFNAKMSAMERDAKQEPVVSPRVTSKASFIPQFSFAMGA